MINFSDKIQIRKQIESFKNTKFLKFQTFKDSEGVFRHVHFKAPDLELENIEKTFGKNIMKTRNGIFILEFQKQNMQWT